MLNDKDAGFVDGTEAYTRTGTRYPEGTNNDGGKCIKITGVAKSYFDIYVPVKAGEIYYIYVSRFDKLGLSGYSFDIDPGSVVDPTSIEDVWLHKYVSNAHIRMMYGGWLAYSKSIGVDDIKTMQEAIDNGYITSTYSDGALTDRWQEKQEHETDLINWESNNTDSYIPGCGNAATDELVMPYPTAGREGVKSLPCRGTFYKFEPAANGKLAVYVLQPTDAVMWFVDEDGKPVRMSENDAFKAEDGGGVTANGDGSFTVTSSTGHGHVACWYTWDIKPGKSYFLFSSGAQLGIYGYTFGALDEAPESYSLVDTEQYDAQLTSPLAAVTVKRTLNPGVWNAICLPFAMNTVQVRGTFGDTKIAVFEKMDVNENDYYEPVFHHHYYQIVNAGEPVLIKPSATPTDQYDPATGTYTVGGSYQYYDTAEGGGIITRNGSMPNVVLEGRQAKNLAMDNAGEYTFKGVYSGEQMTTGSYVFGLKKARRRHSCSTPHSPRKSMASAPISTIRVRRQATYRAL